MTKYQQVPVEKLQKLEEARIELFKLGEKYNINTVEIMQISGIMWELSHKKWNNFYKSEGNKS